MRTRMKDKLYEHSIKKKQSHEVNFLTEYSNDAERKLHRRNVYVLKIRAKLDHLIDFKLCDVGPCSDTCQCFNDFRLEHKCTTSFLLRAEQNKYAQECSMIVYMLCRT